MPKRRQVIYLGWHGFNNFGDDLLHETWKSALGNPLEVAAPLTRRAHMVTASQFLLHSLRRIDTERIVLLGGGTTIGFQNWAKHTRLALAYYSAQALVVAGAGAAASHDTFALNLQSSDWRAWRNLPHVALFGVRGPLTQKECAHHWRTTSVIGDPALLYPLCVRRQRPQPARPVVGVCLGASPTSRFDIGAVADAVSAHLAHHPDHAVRVLQLSREDSDVARELASRLDGTLVAFEGDVQTIMESIAECSLLLSERLHGAVAGVACGVATVPLAYASKCDDFWMSITGEAPVLHVGATSGQILEEIQRATRPERAAVVAQRVHALQQDLLHAVDLLRQWQEGHISSQELIALSRHATPAVLQS
ncbi:polysaccharide pyruvyl transferase family protein [Streptomyces capitiformicae]|nr:polysaccharide pyruvyl transferase family protein [Streptomyces capitiformicae]